MNLGREGTATKKSVRVLWAQMVVVLAVGRLTLPVSDTGPLEAYFGGCVDQDRVDETVVPDGDFAGDGESFKNKGEGD